MTIEDEIPKEFQDHARESANLRQALVGKDKALEAKDRLIADLQRRLQDVP